MKVNNDNNNDIKMDNSSATTADAAISITNTQGSFLADGVDVEYHTNEGQNPCSNLPLTVDHSRNVTDIIGQSTDNQLINHLLVNYYLLVGILMKRVIQIKNLSELETQLIIDCG
jgi:hypothetical protein